MINPLLNPAYSLTPLIAASVGLVLLVVVISRSKRTLGKWLFAGVLISMTLHTLLIFGMRNSPTAEIALPFARIATIPCFAMFALFYQFILTFTKTEGQRYIPLAAYAILVLLIALSPTDLMIKSLRVEDYGYAPVQGIVTYLITPFTFVFLGGTAYNLVRRYKQSSSHNERNRILYLLLAIVFPLVGALLDSFTNLPPAYVYGNLIFCLLTTIAILRYQLLDVRIVIQQGLIYLIMSGTIAVPYVGILYLLHLLIEPASAKWWVHACTILGLAIILHPVYKRAQDWVDRLFYRDRYNYFRALEQFAHEVQSITNLKEVGTGLTHLILGALRASGIFLLLPSEDQQSFFIVSGSKLNETAPDIILSYNSPLVKWMDLHGDIILSEQLDIIPVLQSLSLKDRNSLKLMDAELCVPLKTPQGQLSGILILGPKLSHQPYSDTEKRILITLSSQMAIALENARLYALEKNLREELEQQNKQKTEFLNQVAHEMKTPLTSLISSSELLEERMPGNDIILQRLVGNLRRSADIMNRRVSELLELARTQNREIQLEIEPLKTGEVIQEITSHLDTIFRSRQQHLSMEIAESLPEVYADRGRLEQILYNLLSNANKFSPDGSEIIVRVFKKDNSIVVEVEDEASLITDTEKSKIFTPYYRGEDIVKQNQITGLGLGLYITKNLVEQHGGKIWIDNSRKKGNVFAFSLPVTK